jgi:hypothetical protein
MWVFALEQREQVEDLHVLRREDGRPGDLPDGDGVEVVEVAQDIADVRDADDVIGGVADRSARASSRAPR